MGDSEKEFYKKLSILIINILKNKKNIKIYPSSSQKSVIIITNKLRKQCCINNEYSAVLCQCYSYSLRCSCDANTLLLFFIKFYFYLIYERLLCTMFKDN